MDYPYSPEERAARRQFFQLFCGKYLYECDKADAICAEPWTAEIMYDILQNLYPDNILTPTDIQTIIFMSGMLPRTRDHLYFGYHWDNGVSKEIITAIGPYISDEAYIKLNHTLRGALSTSAEEFYEACCMNPKIPERKITLAEAYDMYIRWCAANLKGGITKKLFVKILNKKGHRTLKGYINGKCGVNYVTMSIDEGRVEQYAEPRREAFRRKKAQIQQAIQDESLVDGSHAEGTAPDASGEKTPILSGTEEHAVRTCPERGVAVTEGGDRKVIDGRGATSTAASASVQTNDIILADGFTPIAFYPTDEDAGYNTPQATDNTSPGDHPGSHDIRWQVNHLPKEQRDAFKEMKITARALNATPDQTVFTQECEARGFASTKDLYELFIEYLRS